LFFTIPFERWSCVLFARARAIAGSSGDEPAPARDKKETRDWPLEKKERRNAARDRGYTIPGS
jgi:hypothetical protein